MSSRSWILVLALCLFGRSALADAKVYHGSLCHPSEMTAAATPVDYFSTVPAGSAGDAASGQVAWGGYLDCPIVRDVTQNTNGLAGARVSIVANPAQPGTAECILSSISQRGAALASQVRTMDTTGTLDFGDTLNQSDALGYYHLFCRMPPSWTLSRYTVEEHDAGETTGQATTDALDAKYYNAAEWCFPSERTAARQGGYFGYPPDGYTTTFPITCPIVRDNSADGIQDFEVTFLNPGQSAATCTLYSVSADGNAVEGLTLMTSDEAGAVTLDYGEMLPLANAPDREGSAYLYCSFGDEPRDWIIKGYRVVERASLEPSEPAIADDQKTYPGSFCRPNLVDAFDRSYFLSVSGYYFQVAETPQVLCPLLRDVTTNTNGLSNIELWISAPGAGSVGCGLYMLNVPGMIVGQGSRGIDFGPEGGVHKIDFSSADGTPIRGEGLSAEGPMGIACSLPKGFAIVGYTIEEFGSGDAD